MHIISNVWHYRVHEMIISSSQLFLCKPRGRVRLNEPINAEYSRLSSYWQIIFLKKWALLKLHCWPETLPCEGLALQVNRMLYLTSSACWTKLGSLLASVHKKANSSHSRSACAPEDDLCPFYVWVWLTSMLVVFLQQQQQTLSYSLLEFYPDSYLQQSAKATATVKYDYSC